jgi:hypothetical protein
VRRGEQGSALVIALLVAFVLSILGASFLMMASAESAIARNEMLAAQARRVAESGAAIVLGWFDRPGDAMGFPTPAQVDRSLRVILDEADPHGPPLAPPYTEYKSGIDLNGDGTDDLFDRPYRGGSGFEHRLMGTELGPDVRIDEQAGDEQAAFLGQLSQALFGSYPAAAVGLTARLTRIDVYAPPYVKVGAEWGRYGVATIAVTGGIFDGGPGEPRMLSQQTVRLALSELPYGTPVFGPVHGCVDLMIPGAFGVHWGTVTVSGSVWDENDDPVALARFPLSIPRAVPPGPRIDRLWTQDGSAIDDYHQTHAGAQIPDPWLRLIARGTVDPALPDQLQSPTPPSDHSNLMQRHDLVGCSEYDYAFWKNVALSRRRNVHYFAYDVEQDDGRFRENGIGEAGTLQELTQGRTGLFFFDTRDGRAPHDDDADGVFDNLTPPATIAGGWWARGMVYANTQRLLGGDLSLPPGATATTVRAPGEPFVDLDADRVWDGPAEPWINLAYPVTLSAAAGLDSTDGLQDGGGGGTPTRNVRGPGIAATVNFEGILFNAGELRLLGSGTFYGSVIGLGDVYVGTNSGGPDLYWDASIGVDWPPPGWGLPRMAVTRWIGGT